MGMQQRILGQSKLNVSAIGLGGMPLSLAGRPSEEDAIRVIHSALDAGISFIDTANVYCEDHTDIGHNERLIAKAVRAWGKRSDVVVATKGGLERPGGRWTVNGDPTHLKEACEKSLRALSTPCIDLYQLHAPDPKVPFLDSVGALADLQQEGKIRYIGLSNVSLSHLKTAAPLIKIITVQNRCNPFDTNCFTDGVFDFCDQNDISFLPYSPMGGSRGKARVGTNLHLVDMGRQVGASPYEIVLAWLRQRSPIIVPIPGASKVTNARSSAHSVNIHLSPDQLHRLDRLFITAPVLKS
jgi:aryl-alcohol dehydrogenase-like predicted oxidoreductase